MKAPILFAFLILALAGTSRADSGSSPILPTSSRNEKPLYYGIGGSTATCVTSIAFSREPGKAAAIGVPILIGGNLLAAKLFHKHPRLAGLLQVGSGLGCGAGAAAVGAPKPTASAFTSTQGQNGANTGTVQPGLTSGSGSGGSLSAPALGGGGTTGGLTTTSGGGSGATGGAITGSSSGNGSVGGSSGTSVGTTTGGSTGSSTGGSTGGVGGGNNFFCTTGGGHDCGLPGNGGFNSGNGVGTIPPGRNP
jgi:hypothetical protein